MNRRHFLTKEAAGRVCAYLSFHILKTDGPFEPFIARLFEIIDEEIALAVINERRRQLEPSQN